MADRSVTVVLIARIADYERGMAQATAVTKKFENELGDLRGKASVDLAHVGETAGDVSRDMTEMAATSAVAAHEVEKVGDNASEAGRDLLSLAARIEVAKAALHGLSLEFAGSGDSSLTPKIRQARRELAELERVAKFLTPVGPASSESLLSGLGAIGSNLRGALIPVVIGAVVALAPTIGAVIAGAVVGGVGLGGIAGGIAMAARDPRVKAAGAEFAAHAADVFRLGGIAFVQPTVESLHILQQGLDGLHLGDALAPLAKVLPDLARGISGFATEAMPGLNRAITAAGPALALLGEELPKVGKAFGDMVGDISESKGAMDGLRAILLVTEDGLGGIGVLISGLSNVFHGFAVAGAEVSGAMEDLSVAVPGASRFFALMNDNMERILGTAPQVAGAWDGIPGRMDAAAVAAGRLGDQTKALKAAQDAWTASLARGATDAITSAAANGQLTASFQAATRAAGGLSAAWDVLHGKQLSADESLLAAKNAVDAMAEAMKRNGGALKGNSEAALENRINMANAGRAASDAAQKYIEAGGSIDGARKIMNDQRAAAEKAAIANGGNAKEVHNLANEMFKLPKNVTSKITVNGTQTAKNAVDALIRSINNVNSRTVTITTQLRTVQTGPVKGFASGTPAAPRGLSWVGERGPELMSMVGGERIWSNPQSMSIARGYAGGTGGGFGSGGGAVAITTAPITVYGGGFAAMALDWLRKEIGKQGGDVQAVLGRRN